MLLNRAWLPAPSDAAQPACSSGADSSPTIKGNHAVGNGNDGFLVSSSTRTPLLDNEARGNSGNGFFVTASADDSEDVTVLQRNTAINNGANGIAVDVTTIRNRIVGNTATGQRGPFRDLLDVDPNGRRPPNTWRGNTFGTISPDCLR